MELWSKLGENHHRILFVGEGNFSFSLSLRRQIWQEKQVVATCFEPQPTSDLAMRNMNALQESKATIETNFDATKMESYGLGQFDLVIFMFPHIGGKMKIHKNRQLLKEFSISAQKVLEQSESAQVIVTLCDGQGGTPFDKVTRTEANSWQIQKMMSFGQFGLVQVERFQEIDGYKSFGYRSLDKEFNADQGTVHIFQRFPLPGPTSESSSFKMLFPIVYHHDLSFWLNSTRTFDEEIFKQILKDHCVINYHWVDSYTDEKTNCHSKTARLTYCSDCYIINPVFVTMTLQKRIGDLLTNSLQVVIR